MCLTTSSGAVSVDVMRPHATRAQNYSYQTRDAISDFIRRVQNNPAYADCIRLISISFSEGCGYSTCQPDHEFGRTIAGVLPFLRNIHTLELRQCFERDFGILASPAHFPHLTTLDCDIPPSMEFESFLAANPTITNLYHGDSGDMLGFVDENKKLPSHILPNLALVECDIHLMGYYIPLHPVAEVYPRGACYEFEGIRGTALASLRMSTAVGGIEAGWGVTVYHLGHRDPLNSLAHAAPNLRHLYLFDEKDEDSDFPCDPLAHFWVARDWERYLERFRRLKRVNVHTRLPFTPQTQWDLVQRWTTSRPATLANIKAITFKWNNSDQDAHNACNWSWKGQNGWICEYYMT